MTPMPWLRSTRTQLLVTLGVALAASLPLLFGDRYGGLDHSLVLLGMQCAVRDVWVEGLALDSALGGGSPLLADPQSGIFYPITWLLFPLEAELAASTYVAIHLAFTAATAYGLGRAFGLSERLCGAFAIAFVCSGTVLNLVQHGSFLVAAAWLPLVWAGAREAVEQPRAGAGVKIAAGLGLLLLGGELQAFGLAAAIVLLETLRGLVRERDARGRLLKRSLAYLGLGLLIGAPQLLPTLALGDAAARSGGVDASVATAWSLGLPEAFGMFWPGIVAERTTSGATLLSLWSGDPLARSPWNPTPYLGLSIVALGLCGLFNRKTRWAASIGLFCAVLSLGRHTPLFGALAAVLPPLSFFRYPAKYFLAATLALSLAAFCTLEEHNDNKRSLGAVAALVVLSLAVLIGVVSQSAAIDTAAAALNAGIPTLPGTRPAFTELLLGRAVHATGFGLLVCLALWKRTRWVPALIALDLMLAVPFHLSTMRPLLETEAPRALVGNAQDTLICVDPTTPPVRLDTADRDWGLAGTAIPQWISRKPNLQQCGGPATPQHYIASATAETVALARVSLGEPRTQWAAAVALGCTHLSTHQPVSTDWGVPIADGTPDGLAAPLYALTDRRPEVVGLHRAQLHPDGQSAVQASLNGKNPFAIAGHLDDPSGDLTQLPQLSDAISAQVQWDHVTSGTIALRGEGATVVVLRRPWWPGFEAVQDGVKLGVARSAGVALAVIVDDAAAGPVALRYRAPGVPGGLGMGAIGLIGLLALWAVGARDEE